ncbi:MAG: hypothetical protein ABI639_15050, partial [Thermoanaerobaculia bacterium]
VLLVTNGLLVESLRIFSNSGRELREPGTELALRLLRDDLHACVPQSRDSDTHFTELECLRTDRKEAWEMDGSRLVRHTYDLDGHLRGTRQMLDRMIGFEWSSPRPGLIAVTLRRRKPSSGSALRVATAAWKSVGDTIEEAEIVAGSRLDWVAP